MLVTLAIVSEDLGYFGPDSVSWQVHKEVTVLFGGARALLMQAAHPLVIAGAGQTGMFERNPWKRLQRTLILTYTLTFGTKAEADAAAERINELHARINGTDPITGLHYDALDPHLLLYVHACLVDSALLFEERTVGALDDSGRQRFHEEQMLAAEMCLVPRDLIPPTVPALRAWMADVEDRGELLVTDNARRVAQLFLDPPREAEWRPVLAGVSRLAFAEPAAARPGDVRVSARAGTPSRGRCGLRGHPRGPAVPAGEVPVPGAVRRVATPAEGRGRSRRGRSRATVARHPARELTASCVRCEGLLLDIDGVLVTIVGADPRCDRGDGRVPLGRAPCLLDHEHDDASADGAGRDAQRGRVQGRSELDRHRGDRDRRALATRPPGRARVRSVRR